jgi:hypothetical protein
VGFFVLESVQTVLSGADFYYWFVAGFSDKDCLRNRNNSFAIDSPTSDVPITPLVQGFYCYRNWTLNKWFDVSAWLLLSYVYYLSVVQPIETTWMRSSRNGVGWDQCVYGPIYSEHIVRNLITVAITLLVSDQITSTLKVPKRLCLFFSCDKWAATEDQTQNKPPYNSRRLRKKKNRRCCHRYRSWVRFTAPPAFRVFSVRAFYSSSRKLK